MRRLLLLLHQKQIHGHDKQDRSHLSRLHSHQWKGEILDLLNRYQGAGAVQNVIADDVTVSKGVDSDSVLIDLNCQPVDSIEKIYINITIS